MSVKVTDNTLQIELKVAQTGSLFLRNFLDEVEKNADPRTPKKDGSLRQNKRKQVLGLRGKLAWLVNYAVYQEVKQFRNYTTSGTGPHFAENAVKKSIANIQSVAKRSGLSS